MTANRFPYIALFSGDDTISREKARTLLISGIHSAFNDAENEVYDPDLLQLPVFLEHLITPSLFGNVRIFLIRHANAFNADDLKALRAILNYDIPDIFVIIEIDEAKSKGQEGRYSKEFTAWLKKFREKVKAEPKRFVFNEYSRPPDYKIAEWLAANVPALYKRRIAKKDAELFVDLVGNDFDVIHSEMSKLDIFLPEGKPITRQTITELLDGTRAMTSFELAEALGKRKYARVMEIIDSLFAFNFYAPMCISAIFRHFMVLLRIKAFEQSNPGVVAGFCRACRNNDRNQQESCGLEIGMAAGLMQPGQGKRVYPKIVIPGIVDQSRAYTIEQLETIFRWLYEYDIGIKTGQIEDSKRYFQIFCFRIMRAGQTAAQSAASVT